MSKRRPSRLKMWLWETYGIACRRDVKDKRLGKAADSIKKLLKKCT